VSTTTDLSRIWLNANEAGMWFNVKPATVRSWASRGLIRGVHKGRQVYYSFADLVTADRRCRQEARGHPRTKVAA